MDSVVEVLQGKVTELERELVKLQRAANRIPALQSDLDALRRSLELVAEKRSSDSSAQQPQPASAQFAYPPIFVKHPRVRRDSQPHRIIQVLMAANGSLTIEMIEQELRIKDTPIDHNAVTSYLSRLARTNYVSRVAENTYAIGPDIDKMQLVGESPENDAAQDHPSNDES